MRSRFGIYSGSLLAACLLAAAAPAGVILVDDTNDAGAGPLRAAIASAGSGDEIALRDRCDRRADDQPGDRTPADRGRRDDRRRIGA